MIFRFSAVSYVLKSLVFMHSDWVFFVNNKSHGTVTWSRAIVVCYGTFEHPRTNLGYVTSIRTIVAHYDTWVVTRYRDQN